MSNRILKGNLAPGGAVAKITGQEGLGFVGKARVFDTENEFVKAVESGSIKKGEKTVVILRYLGPKGGPGESPSFFEPFPVSSRRRSPLQLALGFVECIGLLLFCSYPPLRFDSFAFVSLGSGEIGAAEVNSAAPKRSWDSLLTVYPSCATALGLHLPFHTHNEYLHLWFWFVANMGSHSFAFIRGFHLPSSGCLPVLSSFRGAWTAPCFPFVAICRKRLLLSRFCGFRFDSIPFCDRNV